MPIESPNERASLLLVDECFARADGGFLDALRKVTSPKFLAALADRWKKDSRPWARVQILAYLELPLDSVGHQPLVKRLFKDAEARRDDELMAAFLVAFDTLVRRTRRQRWHWDRETRSSLEEEYLSTPRDVLPRDPVQVIVHPKTGARIVVGRDGRRVMRGRLFTHRTRHYLRRRAWRYFRWLGYARPEAFAAAITPALKRYRDSDLAKGENILDSWALLNICFRECDALEFQPVHLRLNPGRTLGELKAAPRFPEAWENAAAARLLLDLISTASAQLVRMWAMELFGAVRAKVSVEISPEEIMDMLDHTDDRVQQFGAQLFEAHPGLDKLSVETWLRLLLTRNLTALATLCTAFSKHVSVERLTTAQCVDLACGQPVPVARLGQSLLLGRSTPAKDHELLGALADARCPAVAGELATWALARIGVAGSYDLTAVTRFFDSLGEETRHAAWTWLTAGSVGYNDAVLWSRLAETPFEDLRLKLVDLLALRVKTPELSADQLAPVWCAVLLGVHRGGRQKLKAVRDLAEAIAKTPEQAARLLPILAVAVRSIRGPEMRAGLAAVMTLLAKRPELADVVRARLPELQFSTAEVAA
jgi:hypothetical protein